MRRDDRYFVAMIKLIPFLDSMESAKQSSKFIQAPVPGVIGAGVALKSKRGIDGIKAVRPFFEQVIIGYFLPLGLN